MDGYDGLMLFELNSKAKRAFKDEYYIEAFTIIFENIHSLLRIFIKLQNIDPGKKSYGQLVKICEKKQMFSFPLRLSLNFNRVYRNRVVHEFWLGSHIPEELRNNWFKHLFVLYAYLENKLAKKHLFTELPKRFRPEL